MTVTEIVPDDETPLPDGVISTDSTGEAEAEAEGLVLRFTTVDESSLEQLKTLNRVIFPVKYQASPVRSLRFACLY